eukprot:9501864-Pyramimonas_sp.AAC.2
MCAPQSASGLHWGQDSQSGAQRTVVSRGFGTSATIELTHLSMFGFVWLLQMRRSLVSKALATLLGASTAQKAGESEAWESEDSEESQYEYMGTINYDDPIDKRDVVSHLTALNAQAEEAASLGEEEVKDEEEVASPGARAEDGGQLADRVDSAADRAPPTEWRG